MLRALNCRPLSIHCSRQVALNRGYATASVAETVALRFDKVQDPNAAPKSDAPLVFLHGLLGSKRNWTSLTKAFARELNRPVYALDLRNHGDSPHARPHTYEAMSADVLRFFQEHQLRNATLIGHSMGGKVAMSFALHPERPKDALSELIVEDIAPSKGSMSDEFLNYVKTMKVIEDKRVKTRKEATDIMLETEPSMDVVHFLLTNLISPKSKEDHVTFRVPLDILHHHIDDLGSFPYTPDEVQWDGPTLFIKGSKSPFINRKNLPLAQQFFPQMKSVTLGTGHWVHAERPLEFKDAIVNFLKK